MTQDADLVYKIFESWVLPGEGFFRGSFVWAAAFWISIQVGLHFVFRLVGGESSRSAAGGSGLLALGGALAWASPGGPGMIWGFFLSLLGFGAIAHRRADNDFEVLGLSGRGMALSSLGLLLLVAAALAVGLVPAEARAGLMTAFVIAAVLSLSGGLVPVSWTQGPGRPKSPPIPWMAASIQAGFACLGVAGALSVSSADRISFFTQSFGSVPWVFVAWAFLLFLGGLVQAVWVKEPLAWISVVSLSSVGLVLMGREFEAVSTLLSGLSWVVAALVSLSLQQEQRWVRIFVLCAGVFSACGPMALWVSRAGAPLSVWDGSAVLVFVPALVCGRGLLLLGLKKSGAETEKGSNSGAVIAWALGFSVLSWTPLAAGLLRGDVTPASADPKLIWTCLGLWCLGALSGRLSWSHRARPISRPAKETLWSRWFLLQGFDLGTHELLSRAGFRAGQGVLKVGAGVSHVLAMAQRLSGRAGAQILKAVHMEDLQKALLLALAVAAALVVWSGVL